MSEWTDANEREHAAIVHQLRSRGWDRFDANEEADRLMSERIAIRARTSQDKGEPANG